MVTVILPVFADEPPESLSSLPSVTHPIMVRSGSDQVCLPDPWLLTTALYGLMVCCSGYCGDTWEGSSHCAQSTAGCSCFERTLDDTVLTVGPARTEEGSLAACPTRSSLSFLR